MASTTPRISLFALAAYMDADVTQRASIVDQAKRKNDAAAFHYNRARQELVRILTTTSRHDARLLDAVEEFRDQIAGASSDWHERDFELSAEALDRLRGSLDTLRLGDGMVRGDRRWTPLKIEGVRVSVAPDVIVREGDDPVQIGGVKFRFSKTQALSDTEGEYASTILRYYLRDQLTSETRKVHFRLCQIVDVFSGEVFVAKKAFKMRMDRVRKACEEVRMRWSIEQEEETTRPSVPIQPYESDGIQPSAPH